MKITKRLVLLILITQILFVPMVSAYEGILHYAWTYYLALQVGFTERQAYQIASATNAIDWDPETNPVASPLDTKIDTVFGADRFRYFDKDLNPLWVDLHEKLWNDPLEEKDQDATLLSLRKAKIAHPGSLLDGTWQNYYDALIKRNPAIMTWVQLHAFQPIVLQKHKSEKAGADIVFTSAETDRLLLNFPLTSFAQNEDIWKKYLLLKNERVTWLLGKQLAKPEIKNGASSKLDADTFDLFNETINICGSESIKTCLTNRFPLTISSCENLNQAYQRFSELLFSNPSEQLSDPQYKSGIDCEKITISDMQSLITKMSSGFRKHSDTVSDIRL